MVFKDVKLITLTTNDIITLIRTKRTAVIQNNTKYIIEMKTT